MEYDTGLEISIREKALSVESIMRRLSENGFYIIITAVLALLCELINTAINIWVTFG